MTTIRRGELRDADAVFLLAKQFMQDGLRINRDEFLVAFQNTIRPRQDETNVLYVAEDGDGAVIGYTLMTVSRLLHAPGLTAHLQELVVDEEARGRGLGSDLVRANETYARHRGVRQLTMATSRAGGFYERLGYRDVAVFYKKILDLG